MADRAVGSGFVSAGVVVRPVLTRERAEKVIISTSRGMLQVAQASGKPEEFAFDRVLYLNTAERELLDFATQDRSVLLQSIIRDALEGRDRALLVYGGPGGGQDLFLFGSEAMPFADRKGAAQYIVDELLSQAPGCRLVLTVFAVEGEHVLDALSSKQRAVVRIRETPKGTVAEQVTKLTIPDSVTFRETFARVRGCKNNVLAVLSVQYTPTGAQKPISAEIALLYVHNNTSVLPSAGSAAAVPSLPAGSPLPPIRQSSPQKRDRRLGDVAAGSAAAAAAAGDNPAPITAAAAAGAVGTVAARDLYNAPLERLLAGLMLGQDTRKTVLPFHEDLLLWLAKNFLQKSSRITLLICVSPLAQHAADTLHFLRLLSRLTSSETQAMTGSSWFKGTRVYNKDAVLEEGRACVLCRAQPVTHALVPCGHFAFCAECVDTRVAGKCPLCREPVTMKLKIRYRAHVVGMGDVGSSPQDSPLDRSFEKQGAADAGGLTATITSTDVTLTRTPMSVGDGVGLSGAAQAFLATVEQAQPPPAVKPAKQPSSDALSPRASQPPAAAAASPRQTPRRAVQRTDSSAAVDTAAAATVSAGGPPGATPRSTASATAPAPPAPGPAPAPQSAATAADDGMSEARRLLSEAFVKAEAEHMAAMDERDATNALAGLLAHVQAAIPTLEAGAQSHRSGRAAAAAAAPAATGGAARKPTGATAAATAAPPGRGKPAAAASAAPVSGRAGTKPAAGTTGRR